MHHGIRSQTSVKMQSYLILLSLCCLISAATCFICGQEWHQFGDKCFRSYEHEVSFSNAADVCRHTLASEMAVIADEKEQHFLLYEFFPSQEVDDEIYRPKNVWIGGIRVSSSSDDPFRWMGGSKMNFSSWSPGHPVSKSHLGNNCLVMFTGNPNSGSWKDVPCHEKHEVLCMRRLRLPSLLASVASNNQTEISLFSFEITDLYSKYYEAVSERDAMLHSVHVLASLALAMTAVMAILWRSGDYYALRVYYKNRRPTFFSFKSHDEVFR